MTVVGDHPGHTSDAGQSTKERTPTARAVGRRIESLFGPRSGAAEPLQGAGAAHVNGDGTIEVSGDGPVLVLQGDVDEGQVESSALAADDPDTEPRWPGRRSKLRPRLFTIVGVPVSALAPVLGVPPGGGFLRR